MFWTSSVHENNCSIWRSWMDGTNSTQLVTGLNGPRGITIDFHHSRRLYWVSFHDRRVESSDMEGQDFKTILQLSAVSDPIGVGVLGGRLYWTTSSQRTLESSTVSGKDVQLLHNDTSQLFYMTVVPRPDYLPQNRQNHCENQSCTKVCVLTPTSYRCLS